jgi:hypothetical protein
VSRGTDWDWASATPTGRPYVFAVVNVSDLLVVSKVDDGLDESVKKVPGLFPLGPGAGGGRWRKSPGRLSVVPGGCGASAMRLQCRATLKGFPRPAHIDRGRANRRLKRMNSSC